MTQSIIIETVLFKLEAGVTREQFIQTLPASTAFIQTCPGLLARRLSESTDGQWIEHVEWATIEDAKAAAARIMSDKNAAAFMKCIAGSSVQMHHTQLIVKVN